MSDHCGHHTPQEGCHNCFHHVLRERDEYQAFHLNALKQLDNAIGRLDKTLGKLDALAAKVLELDQESGRLLACLEAVKGERDEARAESERRLEQCLNWRGDAERCQRERDEARADRDDLIAKRTEDRRWLDQILRERDDAISLLRQAQTEREAVSDQHDAECDRLERERDEARSTVGKLMFRFAQGCTGDKWRELAEWIPSAEEEARRAWEQRKKEHLNGV